MQLIDSHCHLDFDSLNARHDDLFTAMTEAHVIGALSIGVLLENAPNVVAIAEANPHIYASVGVHPDYELPVEPSVEDICQAARTSSKVIAIGETGLDYFRKTEAQTIALQQTRFRRHIQAAKRLNKPLIVHTRDAGEDTLAILREEKADEVGGIIHCFTETQAFAQGAIELGFFLSFSGILTFPKGENIREVARWAPSDRILVETDSPFLAPVPFRGKTNQPAYVYHTAERLALERQTTLAAIAAQTTANFMTLFPSTRALLSLAR